MQSLNPLPKYMIISCRLIILSLFFCSLAYGQMDRKEVVTFDEAYKRNYSATRLIGERPQIDGILDDSVWHQIGTWSEKFSQVIPFERVHTDSWTRMKICYDESNIYIAVYCKDAHPETMNSFIGNRDDNSNGDLISIAFDPYHDHRAAVEFNINLGGNKTDLTVTDKLSVNLSWNAVWEGKTHINQADSSWTAELRIPFSQLRYNQNNPDGIWGLHVRRIIRKNNEVQNWSLIPIKNNGHVFSFGEMNGMTDLPKPRGIEFLPYAMGKYVREPKIAGSPYQKGHRWEKNFGLDTKIALNDFTMDLTINPDYGQVELDPSVMNLTAYEVYYDEKRPFFLEGKHILEFDNNADGMMFYSRRIGGTTSYQPQNIDNILNFASSSKNVPIIGALKLTGTNKNGVTIGLIESITAQTTADVTRDGVESEEVTEPLTNYTVARVQKNWDGNTLFGGMFTSVNRRLKDPHLRSSLIENALTAGLDFTQYFANRLYYVDAKAMFSSLKGSKEAILRTKMNATHYFQRESATEYLDLGNEDQSLLGTGGYIKVGKKGNAKWNFSETFGWSSPGFDLNDVGYMRQSDYKMNETELAYRQTDPWGPFRFAGINITQRNSWNYGGTAINNDLGIRWRSLSIKKRIEMDIKEVLNINTVDTRRLRGGPDMKFDPNIESTIALNTDRAKRIMWRLDYYGRYYFSEKSSYNELRPGAVFRIGNHIRLASQFNYAWNDDNYQFAAIAKQANGTTVNNAYVLGRMKQNTYGITLNAQFNVTPDISVQYYGSPFTSIATFDEFKLAANTMSSHLADRYTPIDANTLTLSNAIYHLKEGQDELSFNNPNFSFNEFRSNFVARWEYLPGSTVYLVWEHNRSNSVNNYYSGWANNLNHMFEIPSKNNFMIKMNYWFTL